MQSLYTPEFLAQLDDGWLAAHYYDTLCDCGPDYGSTKILKREIERRNLTDEQVSAVYEEHRRRLS